MPRLITVARITGIMMLAATGMSWAFNGPPGSNPVTNVAAFFTVVLGATVLIMTAIWQDWFSNPLTDLPGRDSLSLARHASGKAAMAKWFRRHASRSGSLPAPPKPGLHDPEFLAAWQEGDLEACDRRLDLLAGEMDRREGDEMSRLLHYQRCLERARKAAWKAVGPDRRTASILDETD